MQNGFELPTAPPVSNSIDSPLKFTIDYKAPKIPEMLGLQAEASAFGHKVGFSYYSKEMTSRVSLNDFTGYIIGQYVRLGGAIQVSGDTYRNFSSNLVDDLRYESVAFREDYVKGGLRTFGNQDAVKDWLKVQNIHQDACKFQIILCVYVPELNSVVSIKAGQRIQAGLSKAIARVTGAPNKGFLFSIAKDENQFWAFRFQGQFEKVCNKDGGPWTGKGEMAFEPVLSCGVVTKANNPQFFEQLDFFRTETKTWVDHVKERVAQLAAASAKDTTEMQYPQQQQQAPPPPPQGAYQQPYQQPQYQNTPHIPPMPPPPPPVHSQPQPFPVFNPAQIPPPPQQAPTWQNPPMDPNPTAAQITSSGDDLPF